jgi:hypothetical protein
LHLGSKEIAVKRILIGTLIFVLMTVSFATVGLVMIFASRSASTIEEAVQLVSGHLRIEPRKVPGHDVPLLQKQKSEIANKAGK